MTQHVKSRADQERSACRLAIAKAMADGRERTLDDLIKATGAEIEKVRQACGWFVRRGLLTADIADGCRVYRRAEPGEVEL